MLFFVLHSPITISLYDRDVLKWNSTLTIISNDAKGKNSLYSIWTVIHKRFVFYRCPVCAAGRTAVLSVLGLPRRVHRQRDHLPRLGRGTTPRNTSISP